MENGLNGLNNIRDYALSNFKYFSNIENIEVQASSVRQSKSRLGLNEFL